MKNEGIVLRRQLSNGFAVVERIKNSTGGGLGWCECKKMCVFVGVESRDLRRLLLS